VLVGGERAPVVGTVSMDSFAVRLTRQLERGTPVSLIGDGLLAEEHARVAGTITYELATGIGAHVQRSHRTVRDD
jgi:alanine racemase